MSTNFYAHVVLGIKIEKEEMYEMVGARGCKHDHNSKFCPDCGKPRLAEKERPVLGWDEDENKFRKDLAFYRTGSETSDGVLGILLGQAVPLGISLVKTDEVGRFEHKVRDKLKGTKFEGRPIETYLILEVNS